MVVLDYLIPDTVVEDFGVKLRSFRCLIFVSTFMFMFIYLFPYFGGNQAALVPATVVVGLGVYVVTVHFGRDLFVLTFMFIYVYVGVRFRFCPWWFHLVLTQRLSHSSFPAPARPFPLPNICYVCQA